MRYQVPQFIEVEDKIFGPLTLKQFLYVSGGAAIGFIIWTALPQLNHFLALLIGLPVVGFFMALAFYQSNGRPFVNTVESAIKYFFGVKLYIWKKEEKKPQAGPVEKNTATELAVPKLSDSKLRDLTWSLDINEKLNQ
jgi:hypothetical protein